MVADLFCNSYGLASGCGDYMTNTVDNDIHSSGYRCWFALECANQQKHN